MRPFFLAVLIAFSTVLPAFSQHVTVRIHSTQNYGAAERAYALQAARMLEQLLNSGKFRDTLLQLHYRGGESAQSVYDAILKAHEVKSPYPDSLTDQVVDMWLKLDGTGLDCNGKSIGGDGGKGGYTRSCPNRIQCWAANDCIALMARHLLHEYMHQLGYKHRRPFKNKKVPYVVGNAAMALLTDPKGDYKLKRCSDWPASTGPCLH